MKPVDDKIPSSPVCEEEFSSLLPVNLGKDVETLIGEFAYTLFQDPYIRPPGSNFEIKHNTRHRDVCWVYENQESIPEIYKGIEAGKVLFRNNEKIMNLLESTDTILKAYQRDIQFMDNTFWYMMGREKVYLY